MAMHWRHLRRGEIDHEALWLAVSTASAAGAWFWLRAGLPLPACVFHTLTGCACPTCGATRCVRGALRGDFGAAFEMNPLAFAAGAALVLYALYATAVLALRLRRLRLESVPAPAGKAARLAVITALGANWAWLLWRGV